MTVRAVPEPDHEPPRMRLEIASTSRDPETSVSRVLPDGSTLAVRETIQLTAGRGSGYDYECPFGVPVTYQESSSGQATRHTATLDARDVWLVNPFRPGSSVRLNDFEGNNLDADAFRSWQLPTSRVLVQPRGPRAPIVVTSDGRRAPQGSFSCTTYDLAAAEALKGLVGPDEGLLLNVPPHLSGRVSTDYISIADIDLEYVDDDLQDPVAGWTLPFDVVQRPFGTMRPLWAWDDVEARYDTWDDLEADFDSWDDFEVDRRRVR